MPNYLGLSLDASSSGILGMPRSYTSDPYTYLNANIVTGYSTPRRALFRPFGSPARLTFLSRQDGHAIAAGEKYTYPGSEEDAREWLPQSWFVSFWSWVGERLTAGDKIALYVSCPGYQAPGVVSKYGASWWIGLDPMLASRLGASYRRGGLIVIYDNIAIASVSEPSPAKCVLDAEAAVYNGYAVPFIEPTVRSSITAAVSRSNVLGFGASYSRWQAGETDPSGDPLPKFGLTTNAGFSFITGSDSGTEAGRLVLCDAQRTLQLSRRPSDIDMIAVTGLTSQPVGSGW